MSYVQRFSSIWGKYSYLIAFLIIFILSSILNENFLDSNNLINILRQSAIIGIIALGQTIVILSGGFDLSVGATLALSGFCGLTVLNSTHSIFIGIIATIVSALLIGLVNGLLVTKGKIAPFIVTLGVMAMARSLTLYLANGGSISGTISSFTNIANGTILGITYPIYLFILLTIFVYILLNNMRFGMYLYSIGSNEKASILSAIRVDRIKLMAYMLCSGLVAIAAIIESSRLNSISSSSSGLNYELDSIAAVVIGGTRLSGGKGSIVGTFFGVLILGVLNNAINLMNVSPYLQGLVKGMIIIIAVLLQKKEAVNG